MWAVRLGVEQTRQEPDGHRPADTDQWRPVAAQERLARLAAAPALVPAWRAAGAALVAVIADRAGLAGWVFFMRLARWSVEPAAAARRLLGCCGGLAVVARVFPARALAGPSSTHAAAGVAARRAAAGIAAQSVARDGSDIGTEENAACSGSTIIGSGPGLGL